jgi:hypothetical protein
MMTYVTHCCANCGEEGGASLKACTACSDCQKNHWPKHKKVCKQRTAELRDEALFKDPPPKEDCPICFIPMPVSLICCMSLPPATVLSVPIYDYALANVELADTNTEKYYACCGKSICQGCINSFKESGNIGKCPFCNADRSKTDEEIVEKIMKRVEANDACAMYVLGSYYYHGIVGLQQDRTKAMGLMTKAAELGDSDAHHQLGNEYRERGDLKKATFHTEAAAMAGHEVARYNHGGSCRKHATSYKTLDDCCICWGISVHAYYASRIRKRSC